MFPVKAMVCICGRKAIIDHKFVASAWQARVNCQNCGISAGNSDNIDSAIAVWNRIQCALFAREMVSEAPDMSVMVSFRNDINDYAVRVGTMAQLDKPMSMEIGATCYRADRVSMKDTFIQEGARRYRNAPAFIAWMAQGGVNLERMQ